MMIPTMDFRGQQFVNEDGTLTAVAQSFLDSLLSLMQSNLGQEGLVMPPQKSSDITIIQNNINKSPTEIITYTCNYGTMIYDETNNVGKLALNNGSGVPIFKTIMTS